MKTKNLGEYLWKDEYNVNVGVIDKQHQKFLEILNFLKKVIDQKKCRENLSEIFFSLTHYVEHHLINEEIYYKEYQYPKFNEHKQAHKEFIDRVVKFQEDSKDLEKKICVELYEFLENWFENHILGNNIRATKFLKEQGVS